MGNRYRMVCFLVLAAGSVVASSYSALGLTIEDFEGYASTAELLAAWAPSANGTETLEQTTVFEGDKAMRIDYSCAQGDFSTVFVYAVEEDWTSYSTFSLMYVGSAANSSEKLFVELRDIYGYFTKGPVVVNATKATAWIEYSMDISGWANRAWVKEVRIWLEADTYGSGTVYFDYLLLPSAISVNVDTWSRIKSMYAPER